MSDSKVNPAPHSYREFLAQIKDTGVAKQNRFHISLPRPNKLEGTGIGASLFSSANSTNRMLHLMCKSVVVPGMTIATQPLRLTGEAIEIPYDRTYGAATISFYVDRNFYVRQFFNDWLDTIQSPKTRILSYYDDIVTNIQIFVESVDGQTRYKQILHEALPKSVGELTLDHANNDLMVIDVTFDYRFYETSLLSDGSNGANGIGDTRGGGQQRTPVDISDLFSGRSSFNGSDSDYEKLVSFYKNDIHGFQQAVSSTQGTVNGFSTLDPEYGLNNTSLFGGETRSYRI